MLTGGPPFLHAQYLAQLIHFVTTTHPAYAGLLKIAEEENSNAHEGSPHPVTNDPFASKNYWIQY